MSSPKCLRCGAGAEWLQGSVPKESGGTNEELLVACKLLLDHVDYTTGACKQTEMVGACLPSLVIGMAREALKSTSHTHRIAQDIILDPNEDDHTQFSE